MESARDGDMILARFDDGEDFFTVLEKLVMEHGIASGVVQSGIGMLDRARIGYFNGTGYEDHTFENPVELVTMSGSLSFSDGKFTPHLHVALADRDHVLRGGHLHQARVRMMNEIVIRALDVVRLNRQRDEKTGLTLLRVLPDLQK